MASAQKIRCLIARVISHGRHVYTIELVPEKRIPSFRPGQFLHLSLDEYDPSSFWPESRVFSIASSPNERDRLRISYSVQGRYTARMEQELAEGKRVWVKLPYGEFVIDTRGTVVLYAGGTGITAFTAFIEGLSAESSPDVYLFYGARDSELLIYAPLTIRAERSLARFHPYYFVEHEAPHDTLAGVQPSAASKREHDFRAVTALGRLSVYATWGLIEKPLEATYYIAGPPIMIKTLTKDLLARSVPVESIRIDAWE